MIVQLRHRRLPSWLLILSSLVAVVYLVQIRQLSARLDVVPARANNVTRYAQHEEVSLQAKDMPSFWTELFSAMMRTKPQIPPITVEDGVTDHELDPHAPDRTGKRPDFIMLPDDEVASMKKSHADFVALTKNLTELMPFEKKTKGIVMTAGGAYFGVALTSLLMLRRTGSKLPVQLFLDTAADYDQDICEYVLPSVGAECVIMDEIFKSTPSMRKLEKFQFKVFSIIFSKFQEVLFLDADCWPMQKPDYLFYAEPYTSRGLVSWPDFWLSTSSPLFYEIAGIEEPSQDLRRSSESGIMLYDKAKHASTLALAAYYNFHGPDFYYPLLSQGATGQGDKETFIHAAMVLDNPFYDVQTHIGVLGRWVNGTFASAGMKQADPVEDYELSRNPRMLADNRAKYGKEDKYEDEVHAKWMFVHHNQIKLDITNLGKSLEKVRQKNETGHWQRLWGDDTILREMVGYDPERALWRTILRADCGSTPQEKACLALREWFDDVF